MGDVKKLRVMHVLKSSIYSGAESVVITIIKKMNNDFDFLYLATEGTIRERLEQEQISFLLLKEFNRNSLRQAIGEWKPDIVHAHDFSATVFGATVSGRFRLISHLHYDPPWVRRWNEKTLFYTLCSKRISRILTVSDNTFQNMVFAKRLKEKWSTIGNPVDVRNIRSMAEQPFQDNQEIVCDLIFVGRFVEQKNPQRFIRLVAELKKDGWNDIQCWMLGTGELLTECEAMIASLELQNNIVIKGFQENPYTYIKRSKVMCITSRWEGFGLVALEANILGIPVLSTRTAGCSEILGAEGEELCDTDEQFVQKLRALCTIPEMYKSWQTQSLARANRCDNMDKYMAKMSCIYRNEVSE